jgi:hypothetical protein
MVTRPDHGDDAERDGGVVTAAAKPMTAGGSARCRPSGDRVGVAPNEPLLSASIAWTCSVAARLRTLIRTGFSPRECPVRSVSQLAEQRAWVAEATRPRRGRWIDIVVGYPLYFLRAEEETSWQVRN